ncbi:hypothetical protein HGRIS_014481 [Hohenbuehelia grisea]|uniref:Nephrocystin 3-like N-terminal domain-containing protein n=1 Tax=Hohenbuehelia grisea TaxID=104357 RepID=A0ABR3JTT8_9AGAR
MAFETDAGCRSFLGLTFIKAFNLPQRTWPQSRHKLYAKVYIEGLECRIPNLKDSQRPVLFYVRPTGTLIVELWDKSRKDSSSILARQEVELRNVKRRQQLEVTLDAVAEGLMLVPPVRMALQLSDVVDFKEPEFDPEFMKDSLEIRPRISKAFEYIQRLVNVGSAISELIPPSKAVMGLVALVCTGVISYMKRNEVILGLVEDVGMACTFIVDWEDSDNRPSQRRVYEELLPEITSCINLLWALSGQGTLKKLSSDSIKSVTSHRQNLVRLIERAKSNQLRDTQMELYKVSADISHIRNHNLLGSMHRAEGAGADSLRRCLSGTRESVLVRLQEWAGSDSSERALLLHGVAGKGKSAIIASIASRLQADGSNYATVVPFFAFNQSNPGRSLSRLIPTWVHQLALHNRQYLSYLHSVERMVGVQNIDDQLDIFLEKGLIGIANTGSIVFTIDALDECPESEAVKLAEVIKRNSRPA